MPNRSTRTKLSRNSALYKQRLKRYNILMRRLKIIIILIPIALLFTNRYCSKKSEPVAIVDEVQEEQSLRIDPGIKLVDGIFYNERNKSVIIEKNILENETFNVRPNYHAMTYEFLFNFKEYPNAHKSLQHDYLKEIIVNSDLIRINTHKISEFNIYGDETYYYIRFLTPKEKYNRIVFIDPGHGGNDEGASSGNITEKDINLNIGLKLYDLINSDNTNGITAYMSRISDVWLSPEDRVIKAEDIADFKISIHNNFYAHSTEPHGTETHYRNNNSETLLSNEELSRIVQRHLIAELGSRDRGLIHRTDLHLLNRSTLPTALIEVGYLSNPNDLRNLTSESYLQSTASALYSAIKEVFDTYEFKR